MPRTPDLPLYVSAVPDRHGKTRYRFRRKGTPSAYINAAPGTAAFHKRYAELLALEPAPVGVNSPDAARKAPGTVDALIASYRHSPKWKDKGARTKLIQGRKLDRFADTIDQQGRRYGTWPVKRITVAMIDKVLGRMSDTPAAANELRKVLSGLMAHAFRTDAIAENPVPYTTRYKDGAGYPDWSEEEIAQYRARHPYGTMARLTMELALNVAGRRCEVALIERTNIANGRIDMSHAKGNNATSVRVSRELQASIDALPVAPIRHLIVTQFGRPFTVAGLGNKMRDWCDQAGLKGRSLHGLKKAQSRRLAESGASDAQGRAVTGHKKDSTFAYYAAAANRTQLADAAMSNLSTRFDVQPEEDA
jgi:hypothetical protein